jgi:hypothetical protein
MPDPKQLLVFIDAPSSTTTPVPPPTPTDVLYERGSGLAGKSCANCGLYAEQSQRCLLFGVEKLVTPEMVCGYHAQGTPQLFATTLGGKQMVDPALAGLIVAPQGGTCCGGCRHYAGDTKTGSCAAVFVDGQPAPVEFFGCCTRWRQKDEGP